MSVISAIAPAARHPGRFDVFANDEFIARLSIDALERLQLSVGIDIADIMGRVEHEAALVKVYDRALNMLAFRARSSAELARALVRKGEAKEFVDHAIGRLLEQGLLDDAAFAQAFTRAKVLGANQSRRRVQQGLAKKGVPREISTTAIATVFEDEAIDRQALVEQVARRKMRSLARLEPIVRKRRLYGFLARRGYENEDIRRAMQAVGAELDSESGAEPGVES